MALKPGLYAITDPELLPGEQVIDGVAAALRGGAVLIQYRDKVNPPSDRRRLATRLLALCRRHRVPLVINDDLELALRIGADGVHLGLEDGNLAAARRRLGPDRIVGATCHGSLRLAQGAAEVPCSYLAFGRFFASSTKAKAPPASPNVLSAGRRYGLPVTAIGGITRDNMAPIVAAGADLIAMVHGLFAADDIEQRARELNEQFHRLRKEFHP
ncbi:thiamine phosphate synthase [Marinobacteraceae bacterium S3BR75-40.1]